MKEEKFLVPSEASCTEKRFCLCAFIREGWVGYPSRSFSRFLISMCVTLTRFVSDWASCIVLLTAAPISGGRSTLASVISSVNAS